MVVPVDLSGEAPCIERKQLISEDILDYRPSVFERAHM